MSSHLTLTDSGSGLSSTASYPIRAANRAPVVFLRRSLAVAIR